MMNILNFFYINPTRCSSIFNKCLTITFGIVISLSITGCSDNNEDEDQIPPPTVYIASTDGGLNGVIPVVTYWKDSTAFPINNANRGAFANSIFVEGNDVYVAGLEHEGQITIAKYWKNGIGVSLTSDTNNANALSIFVAGNDVYVAG